MLAKLFQNRYINISTLGAICGFSMPPFCIWPILFFGLSYLFVCLCGSASIKQRFVFGYLYGFFFFAVSLNWIACSAFAYHDPDLYIFYPVLLFVIPFYLGFFMGVPSAMMVIFKNHSYVKQALAFGLLISIFEWVRSFFGIQPFCWNVFGHAFCTSIYTLQITSIFGVLGLSLFSIILFIIPGLLVVSSYSKNAKLFSIIYVSVFIGINIFGFMRVKQTGFDKTCYIRIIQPNIKQHEKRQSKMFDAHIKKINNLILKPSNHEIKMAIMPETSIPMGIHDNFIYANILMPDCKYLLAGANVYHNNNAFNSLVVIDTLNENISMRYDKMFLVAFVERNPFFPLMHYFANTPNKYLNGNGPKTFHLDGVLPFAPIVCFDSIFTSKIINKNDRPKWILQVTNDAWWPAMGSLQHLYIGGIRAIEEGLPIARSANTGVSCIIDCYGCIIKKIDLNKAGVLDSFIPKSLDSTIYSRYGTMCYFFLIFIICGTLVIRRKGNKKDCK